MFGGSPSVGTQQAEAVGVVDEDAEFVFLLQGHQTVQLAQGAGHAEHALGDEEHAAAVLFGLGTGTCEDLFGIGQVVVAIFVFAADVQADTVQQAGMALGIVNDDVVARGEGIDRRDNALIAEVIQEGVLLLLEVGENLFQFLVITRVTGHHAGAHRIGKAPVRRRLGVGFAHLGVVGQAEVVVQGPVQHGDAVKGHVRAQLAFQAGVHVVTETLFEILADRATAVAFDTIKNIQHIYL